MNALFNQEAKLPAIHFASKGSPRLPDLINYNLCQLAALILEDLKRYPQSAISDIRQRIGGEIYLKQVKRALDALIDKGDVRFEGENRWRRYWLAR
ncbi:MAG: hypothetical protein K8H75_02160 [Sulfuricella sp.]|nr:hypothetical protein [Sulfuricella sp.]